MSHLLFFSPSMKGYVYKNQLHYGLYTFLYALIETHFMFDSLTLPLKLASTNTIEA